jgi:cell division protein FtsI/penicillin-binding protein 2
MTRLFGTNTAKSRNRKASDWAGQEDPSTRPSWFFRSPRLTFFGWAVILIFGLFLIRIWQLQFLEGGAWRTRAEQQQTRLETISPPRGVMTVMARS